jgi:membrane protein CcdC involved in cytochrome C biogenesis
MVAAVLAFVIWRRTRSTYRPMNGTGKHLLVPIFFLLPFMIILVLNPNVHAYLWEWVAALGLGALLSIPLIWTTNYELREDRHIYAKKNTGFIVAFIAIVMIRLFMRDYMGNVEQETQMALFMVVAVGYIVPWRIVSYKKFRELHRQRQEFT